ncbi:hypothetical protein PSTT_04301 [Puccinia striiformis]|uniref:AMP-dependent synthetase/ligase domain-containing protein n=1 Tax=Puccinia striiformis TaxID=27350 RepID=A0A2S4VT06_9BASI|nr:hypothetical protein PSTT_04301 [Puccinia striiformis]
MSTLPSILWTSTAHRPSLILPPSSLLASETPLSITYNELKDHVDGLASKLERFGLPQISVSLSLVNSVEFVVAFLALAQNSFIVAPLNPTYTLDEAGKKKHLVFNYFISGYYRLTHICLNPQSFIYRKRNPSENINLSLSLKKDLQNKLIINSEFFEKRLEFEIIISTKGDLSSSPSSGAILAARKLGIPIAEISFNLSTRTIEFNLDLNSSLSAKKQTRNPIENDVVLLLHTSGTTGRPKAVPLTHKNMIATTRNIQNTYNLTSRDRSFLVMPLFHVHGLLAGLLSPLVANGSCVIPPKFAARTFWSEFILTNSNVSNFQFPSKFWRFEVLKLYSPFILLVVHSSCKYMFFLGIGFMRVWLTEEMSIQPTIHQILLRIPARSPIPKIRFIRSCSSALSPTTHAALERAFQTPVLEAYAMTEATHQMTSNPLPPSIRKPGSVGKPQGVELKILKFDREEEVEEGEVCIRGSNVTSGYLNNETANKSSFTTPGGFFRTGDRGKLDSDGYLFLTGRIKELINRGGEKISPIELDSALLSIHGIIEAVTFAVPDQKYGEVPWAAVVLDKSSKKGTSENEIKVHLSKKLGKFKIPEKILIVDSIPKTATGKVQRRKVSEKFFNNNNNDHPKARL